MSNKSTQIEKKKGQEKSLQKRNTAVSERFIKQVASEMEGAIGQGVEFTEKQKRLAINLFMKTDEALKNAEAERLSKGRTNKKPYTWDNVNMQKLALDSVHRIRLGLDALIPNHIHPIPYYNTKKGSYDMNLMIGYKGKQYYRVKHCVDKVVDIRYELVYSNDHFAVRAKSFDNPVEAYEFVIKSPFDRGKVIGGFAYIVFEEEVKNKLIVITEEKFKKIKDLSVSGPVWKDWGDEMRLKTLVHRATDYLTADPDAVTESYHYVESQDNIYDNDLLPENDVTPLEQPEEREPLDFDEQTGEIIEPEERPVGADKIDEQIKQEGLPFG